MGKIPIRCALLFAALLAGIPTAIIAMHQDNSNVSLTAVSEPELSLSTSVPSKANCGTKIGCSGLFDLNGDGIMDAFDKNLIYISDGDSYIEKKIEYASADFLSVFRWDYVYQLNDDVMVGLGKYYYYYQYLVTFSKSEFQLIDYILLEAIPADVDNDGQTEYLVNDGNRDLYYKIGPDGKIASYPLLIYIPETKTEESDEDSGRSFVAWDYSMLGASMAQMFGRDGGGGSVLSSDNIFQVTDLNGDGLPDIVKSDGAKIYINIGNGTYYEQSFTGKTFFADFNCDGICDYLVVDGTNLVCCLTDPEGGEPSEKTILSGFTLQNIWCRDVDKDGDSDLILIVTGTSQCFGVIMENNGKGTFKRHEYSLPHLADSAGDCTLYDWDNDGNYEIICGILSTKITGTTIVTTPATLDLEYDDRGIGFYPEPSDGRIKAYQYYKATQTLADNINNRPTSPAEAPSVVYEPNTGLLKILWSVGEDVETPVADLTYSVKVGTSSGAGDVVCAQAKTDGMRLWPGEGNAGRMLYRIYDTSSWPKGKLYISVQSVDGNMQGSEFSDETVFEKPVPACEFQMDYCDYFAVNDTLTLTVNCMEGTPQWNVDDGRIVGSFGNIFKVVFAKGGEKTVSLTVVDEAGNISAPKSKKLNVLEAPVHVGSIIRERQGEIVEVNAWTSFDMDEDGTDEIYCSLFKFNEGGFLKGDADGVYRKIEKMFNSHEYAGKFYKDDGVGTFDINRDGLCDIVYREYLGYNLGDLDMEFENTGGGLVRWIDLDNDGLYDAVGNGAAYRNDGDYKSFKSKSIYFGNATLFGDFNHDGLVDIADATNYGRAVYIRYNNGDFTFTEGETIVLPDNFDFEGLKAVEDIDLDGKLDVLFDNIYHYNGERFWTVLLGNGEVITRPGYVSGYYDFNNDGKKEIIYNSGKYSICYFSCGIDF